ncbi:MAG: aldo/keto reductase, partial [Planctomycetota bacterium]
GLDPTSAEGRMQGIRSLRAARDAGISFSDTAPGYGDGLSESIIGEALLSAYVRRDGPDDPISLDAYCVELLSSVLAGAEDS